MSERTLTADTTAADAAAADTAGTIRIIQSAAAKKQALAANVVSLLQAANFGAVVTLLGATDAQARAATATTVALTPANFAGRSAFSAYLASNQTGNADNAYAQVVSLTEVSDRAGDFATSAWTPPAGLVYVHAQVNFAGTNLAISDSIGVRIYKNGSGGTIVAQQIITIQSTTDRYVSVGRVDLASGSDVYTMWAFVNNAANGTWDVGSGTFGTFFQGWQI